MNYFQSCCQCGIFLNYILGVFVITYSKEKKEFKNMSKCDKKIVTLDSSHTIPSRKVEKKIIM